MKSILIPNTRLKKILFDLEKLFERCCRDTERADWESVLPIEMFPYGSEQRCILATLFITATKGLSDKVSCGHFRIISPTLVGISLSDVEDPLYIASIMFQTSKWVKNSVHLAKLFKYIKYDLKGLFPKDFTFWVAMYEFGTKTASLFLKCAFNLKSVVPVDTHVKIMSKQLMLTNGTSTDEICWQLSKFIDPEISIRLNDYMGSIRQKLVKNKEDPKIILVWQIFEHSS